MEENKIKVYVKLDSNNVITEIASSIQDIIFSDYIQIDEGTGDKYAHAQGNYLIKGLTDSNRKYNYKLVDGKILELTDLEKEELFPTTATSKTELEILKETVETLVLANLGV